MKFIAPTNLNIKSWVKKTGINSIKVSNILILEVIRIILKSLKCTCRKWYWKKKKSYFKKELAKTRNKPKELWKTLKPLSLSSDKARKSKISLTEDGTIQFEALEKANTFKKFYSELAGDLQEQLPKAPNKFTNQTTKNYNTKTSWNVSNDFELSNVSDLKRLLKRFSLALIPVKLLGIPAKVLTDGAEVLAFPLRNTINLKNY